MTKSAAKITAQKSEKLAPTLEFEVGVGFPTRTVAGVDEVGRGCLAGDVVAGACVLPSEWGAFTLGELKQKYPELALITDSKQLSPEMRDELEPWIRANVRAFGIGSASVAEIDHINIFHASHLAMVRAVDALAEIVDGKKLRAECLLVDGKFLPKVWSPHPYSPEAATAPRAQAIIKGDLRSLSISCASILAKVYRDREITLMDEKYPGYGFAAHKGYATPTHKKALRELGACAIHRRSFAPVKEVLGLVVASDAALDAHQTELF